MLSRHLVGPTSRRLLRFSPAGPLTDTKLRVLRTAQPPSHQIGKRIFALLAGRAAPAGVAGQFVRRTTRRFLQTRGDQNFWFPEFGRCAHCETKYPADYGAHCD